MEALYQKKHYDNWLKTGQLIVLLFSFSLGYGQIAAQKDCPTAMRICDVTQSYYFEVTNNIGAIDDAYGLDQIYCQWGGAYPTWEWNPAWFVFTPQYSGQFGFLICPEITTMNWDWALFENPVCTDLNNVAYHLRCNTQPPAVVAEGCTGIGFKNGFGGGGTDGIGAYINVTAGNTYVLYAYSRTYPDMSAQRATLSFQGAVVAAHPDLFTIPSCLMGAEDFIKNEVQVFPNPFTNSLQVESETTFTKMMLYDVAGKQIFSQHFTKTIDMGNLAQGMYLLHLITEDGDVVVKKVVKE